MGPPAAWEAVQALAQEAGPSRLLHGDFHHGNVLKGPTGWRVIDPKGVWGPLVAEVGPILANPLEGAWARSDSVLADRIASLAGMLACPPSLVRRAAWIHGLAGAHWGGDPRPWRHLAQRLA